MLPKEFLSVCGRKEGDGCGALNNIAFLKICDSRLVYILTQIFIVPEIDKKMQSKEIGCESVEKEKLDPTQNEICIQVPSI